MPDFRAALALAKQNLAVSSGNSGNSGNAPKAASKISSLGEVDLVATTEMSVATVATNLDRPGGRSHSVASVASTLSAVATLGQSRFIQQNQRSTEPVATVASVASVASGFEQAEDFPAVPVAWIDGILSLNMSDEPCPGFRSNGHWLRVYDALHDFIASPRAAEAVRLGWTAELLFGVHPIVGLNNVAACGAVILADRNPIECVKVEAIRFGKLVFRQPPAPAAAVPVWSFAP